MLDGVLALCAVILLLAVQSTADKGLVRDYRAYQNGDYGTSPNQRYWSSEVQSPLFQVTRWRGALIDTTPYLFFNLEWNDDLGHRVGPYIFDSRDLSLVYGDASYMASNNGRIQMYRGQPVFTYWAGVQGKGHASGNCLILNNRYEVMFNVSTVGLNTNVDLHECELTADGTVLVTAYEPIPYDLTAIGGNKSDMLLDSVFQEIDPVHNTLLFDWHGSHHIPITDSFKGYEHREELGWEAYHINSLQKSKHGNYFVSFRRTHALMLINGTDKSIVWQMGGRHSDFADLSDGRATNFAWQHHARFIDDDWTQLTLFDNHNLWWEHPIGCAGDRCSRGMRLQVDHANMSAKLVQEYWAPQDIGAYAMGSYDHLPNGNALIGWGSISSFSEYTADGQCVMDVQYGVLGSWVRTYRVYKSHWHAHPTWPPAIAAPHRRERNIFVSWNGATEVRSWAVLAHNDTAHLERFDAFNTLHDEIVLVVRKVGFETHVPLDTPDRFVRAVALDAQGAVLGATGIVDMDSGNVTSVRGLFDQTFMLEYPHKQ